MFSKVCVELNCYHICKKSLIFFYPHSSTKHTSKKVSWLHFSWPTLYIWHCWPATIAYCYIIWKLHMVLVPIDPLISDGHNTAGGLCWQPF